MATSTATGGRTPVLKVEAAASNPLTAGLVAPEEAEAAEAVTAINPLTPAGAARPEDIHVVNPLADEQEAAAGRDALKSAATTSTDTLPVAVPVADTCDAVNPVKGLVDEEAGKKEEKNKCCDPCHLCCCSWSVWNPRCSGKGAPCTWTCIVCSLFWVSLVIALLIIYLPRFFGYDDSPYVCPAAVVSIEESVPPVSGYQLVEEYTGASFLDGWTFFTADDPTQGYVNFVSKEYAGQKNLTYFDEGSGLFYLKTDTTNVVPDSARGRDSIRLHSDRNFTFGVFIAALRHMPEGCGTWPAWWMMQDPWPLYGEIDIIENINREGRNSFVGHTKLACDTPAPEDSFQGVWKPKNFPPLQPSSDCGIDTNPQGCAQYQPPGTASKPFNAQGGGVHALVWDEEGMRTYFWSYSCGGPPPDVLSNNPVPNTWGKPLARFEFSADMCVPERYQQMYMVINLTYCGTWAGTSGWFQCIFDKGFSCNDFVKDNPAAFEKAYWAWEYVKVFQLPVNATNATAPDKA